jgi:hypothetical protein
MSVVNSDLSTLRQKIANDLANLVDRVSNDAGGGGVLNAAEQFILTRTGLPILKLIQTVSDLNPALASAVVLPYTDAIVADVAYSYFRSTLMAVETALQQSGTGTQDQRNALTERVRNLLAEAQRDRNSELARIGGMEEFMNKVSFYQRVLASSMTPSMQQRLAFARVLEVR